MPQVTRPNGIDFGDSVYRFVGLGDPSLRVGDDTISASDGSVYWRRDPPDVDHCLYVRIGGAWIAAKLSA